MAQWDVNGKVVLVTGGAAGIGAKLVRGLLARNARYVAFLDVAAKEGAALEGELLNKFGALRVKFIKCDMADADQVDNAYKQILDKYRRLDAVVNCAAVLSDAKSSYKTMVDVNFCGTVTSTLKAFEIMRADKGGGGGVVINVSSLHAFQPCSYLSVYGATKAAVLQFSNSFAAEEAYTETKVRVITVCLGPTDTALVHKLNLENSAKDSLGLTSGAEPQRVESAVTGIIEVIHCGENGTTWIIANDKAALDVTKSVKQGLEILSNVAKGL
ncbi:15-hydroxyprostaglandin dehydrogenase [NAD(+)]-like [Zerene cesonia]|uniref:15-hydroxyprostaglandin dehydrogenase [NAD(+)]-like n=1 Tax=Zerene cesonia TaxID=33412 RepID=UPI0018E5A93F|nr:15-hydroxyprostaglandin dehydrogenase [NAD(+)]-like [Zerene cesonia]